MLYTGLAPFSPGPNTTLTMGAGWIEVDELYRVESFSIDIAHGRVDVAFVSRDGSGTARLRFDLVTDLFVQPGRCEGISAIEDSWPPPSMGMDGFDEIVVLRWRIGSLGGRFLVIVGAFDLLIEARSVWFTQQGRRA